MIIRAALTALLTRAGTSALRANTPGGRERWERTNHAGRTVDLCAGAAGALAVTLTSGLVDGPGGRHAVSVKRLRAVGVPVLLAGVCGAYDDVVGAGDSRRGFRAHLSALKDGEVTSGAVKLFGVGAAGLLAGALLKERAVDKVLAGVVVAGAAHFVNLVDVRPGRAVGVVLALGAPGLVRGGAAGELSAAAMGAAAAVLPDDVGERSMLGDTGAHALGAALGAAFVAGNGRAGLVAHAAALVAAAVQGDRVSDLARSRIADIRPMAHPSG
ncbi:hypothetical protein [Streptomyces sp. NPDC003635]